MSKSQNTKKDLCITSEQLTKQWKKGQLESFRCYYAKSKTGEIDICWFTEWSNAELKTGGQYFDGIEEENILEVLAPVPSYEEWQAKLEENAQLKELLKECKGIFDECFSPSVKYGELYKQIDEVLNANKA